VSYRLDPTRPPGGEFARVAAERIQHAVRALARYPDPDPEGLHTARKDIKKARALLRLARHKKLRPLCKALNVELGRIGIQLSGHRDHEVLAVLVEGLRSRLDPGAAQALREALGKLTECLGDGARRRELDPVLAAGVTRRLKQVRAAITQADFKALTRKRLRKAAAKRRKRVLRAYRDFLARPDATALHDWRKQLKNHLYHLRQLRRIDPPPPGRLKRVSKLERLLGKVRDLDLLERTIEDLPEAGLDQHQSQAVQALARRERESFLEKALKLAPELVAR
jgi:CHAD domain-containing protein